MKDLINVCFEIIGRSGSWNAETEVRVEANNGNV